MTTSSDTRRPASGGSNAAMEGARAAREGGVAPGATMRGPPTGGPRRVRSEARERAVARIGNLEERVELRELEQGLEVVVQVREPELPALLADLLGERDQHAQPGAVDVARLGEVDEEFLLSALELVQHLLLELLSIADNELAFHVHHDNLPFFLDRKAHVPVSWRNSFSAVAPASPACSAVMAATLKMSSEEAPRERSLHGRLIPWRIGPTARANANRWASLYAMLPASSEGKTSTFALPPTALSGAFRADTSATSAASPCNSPSTASSGDLSRIRASALRTRSTLGPTPLPRVPNESNATRGSSPTIRRRSRAAARAMSASCSAVG